MNIIEPRNTDFQEIADLVINVAQIDVFPSLNDMGQRYFMSIVEHDVRQALEDPHFQAYKVVIDSKILGFGAIRNGHYITQLFVAKCIQGCGIGGQLLRRLLTASTVPVVELKSSLNAVPFYLNYGFEAQGSESEINGIRFLPMQCVVPKLTCGAV